MVLIDTLLDVLSTRRHTRYFNQTRANYLFKRVRLIALLLAVVQPAWLVIDYWVLPEDMHSIVTWARLLSAGACLFVAFWYHKNFSLTLSYARLSLLLGTLLAFHVATASALQALGHGAEVAGYHFFPFMIITMMAVFPLSIAEAAIYTFAVFLVELVLQLSMGTFASVASLDIFWLLAVLAVIAGWASVNQLNMLLGLYRQATRDPLTSLSNRRQGMEQLDQDMAQSREHGKPLSILLFDLDKFKVFNDTYGHAAGDIVLQSFAKLMQRHARESLDTACRYGGEEFLMILPGMNGEQASKVADEIRSACHAEKVETPSGESIGFTTSIGIAELKSGESRDLLLQRSDEALYLAKGSGRDRFQLAE